MEVKQINSFSLPLHGGSRIPLRKCHIKLDHCQVKGFYKIPILYESTHISKRHP